MDHEAVGAAYDQLAERWLDDRFPVESGMSQHARALAFLSQRGGAALNVGCGCNTRITRLLRESGLQPEGIDISTRMVELARESDPATPVHHADICAWEFPRAYRFISAWDSIWHVALHEQRRLLTRLMGALEPGGVLLFTAGGLDHPSEHVDACMGPSLYYASLGIPGIVTAIHEAGGVCRHLEFDQRPETHLVVIAQRRVVGESDPTTTTNIGTT